MATKKQEKQKVSDMDSAPESVEGAEDVVAAVEPIKVVDYEAKDKAWRIKNGMQEG